MAKKKGIKPIAQNRKARHDFFIESPQIFNGPAAASHQNHVHGIRRIELYDSLPWKISVVCREDRKNETCIKNLLASF